MIQSKNKGKHITERERYKLEYMLKDKKSVQDIADELGKSRSTIYREIKRGSVKQLDSELIEKIVYLADYAQRDYDSKKHEKGRYLKVGNDMKFIRFVEEMIGGFKYSPVATLYMLKNRADIRTRVCHRTLYRYIHSGLFLNLTSSDLPYKVSKKREKERVRMALCNVKGRSIEERPRKILERSSFGHWEMDTVCGGLNKSKDCLLVLTERMTRQEEIYHISNRSQSEVVRVLNDIEKRMGFESFIKRYKTITSDNGTEFLDYDGIEFSVVNDGLKRTVHYYCHPFCSSERGSNENANKLIRRWIPKGSDIAIFKEQIPNIQNWINNYPRQLFGGLSSNQYLSLIS